MPGSGELTIRGFTGGPFAQNSYLVSCVGTRKAILVDAGAGVPEMLEAARAEDLDIEAIVLTHAHLDHIDQLAHAKRELDVPVYLHADDDELYRAAPTQAQWFGMSLDALPAVDRRLQPGDTLRVGECELEVRHVPGHAPGHVILVGDGFALSGDTVFAGSIGRTDLPGGDFQTLLDAIRREILSLPDETVLYSGHGPETTVGHERTTNPFLTGTYGGSGLA